MTKVLSTLLLCFFIHLNVQAQGTAETDALALKIPQARTYASQDMIDYLKQNFSTDTARLRAIYVWITNNINYDVAKLQASITNREISSRQSITDVLKTRTAVCQGFVDLFIELCKGVGIKAVFVGGYTKKDGEVNLLPHAWVGVELAGTYYLIDPTWGAGYIKDNQFVRAANNRFYKVSPADMIKDHMPFDPMYQFLNHTITNKEFIDGQTTVNTSKPYFNYADTLKQFALLTSEEKLKSEARRLEASGIRNELLQERLNFLKNGTEHFLFDQANAAMKQAIALFNQYIGHKNKQLTTIDDKALQQMTDSISYYSNRSRTLLQQLTPSDEANKQLVSNSIQHLEKFQQRALKEKEFVARYLSTDKSSRKQLFSIQ